MINEKQLKMYAKRIRGMINGEIKHEGKASLVSIMAKYDIKEHAIPSAEEFNLAFKDLKLSMFKQEKDIVLTPDENAVTTLQISKDDLCFVYNNYIKLFNSIDT